MQLNMFIIFFLQVFDFISMIVLVIFNLFQVIFYNFLGVGNCSEESYLEGEILKVKSKKRDSKIINVSLY